MKNNFKTETFLIEYCRKYPRLEIQDLLKTLHQSVFGCGHFLNSNAYEFLCNELESVKDFRTCYVEALDGEFSRIYLSIVKNKELSAETLFKLFLLSSDKTEGNTALLEYKLSILLKLVKNNRINLPYEVLKASIADWRNSDYKLCRHSDIYRKTYAPSYRVVHNDFIRILPLLSYIDKNKDRQLTIAIDGGSASGKTTLASLLSEIYECNVFHMDDFFLRSEQRTKERLNEPGGNVDRERFLKEVLLPLSEGRDIDYRPYDCHLKCIKETNHIKKARVNIIEGAYSMHPELLKFYDYRVFMDIDESSQRSRIIKRNSTELQKRFFNEWIPLEDKYFKSFDIKNSSDLIIGNT